MSDSWDEYADGWDSNAAVVAYADNAYQALINTTELNDCRIFDFGCGTGLLAERMSQKANSVVALDPAQKMIAVLESKQLDKVFTIASELNQQVLEDNELLSAKFDVIVASSALAFVPDYVASLKLLKQLMNKGGCLVQLDWLKEESAQGYGFSEQQIISAMTEAGFEHCTTSVPFALPSEAGEMNVVMAVAKLD